MKPKLIMSLFAMSVLVLSYQNCSNSMSFQAKEYIDVVKPNEDGDPNAGDPVAGDPSNPINAMPRDEEDDLDTDIDYNHEGRRIGFSCVTGARFGWDENALKNASDLTLRNSIGLLFHYARPLRNVSIENLRGSVAIKNAYRTVRYDNVSGVVSYVRSLEIDRVANVQSIISVAAAIKLTEMANIKSTYVCASGQEIGRVLNLEGSFMKFRGRQAASASQNAKAIEFANIKTAFASIYKIDVPNIRNFEGELIIRNSRIGKIESLKGGLTLINSTVDSLVNVQGIVRVRNSKISVEDNVVADRVDLLM